jgi:methylase of polypeptide subunit release factors
MIALPDGRSAGFISESGQPEPTGLEPVDEETRADAALRMLQAGKELLWTGGFPGARQLLSALRRRLKGLSSRSVGADLLAQWQEDRAATREKAETLGGLMVLLEPDGSLDLRRAPETRGAVDLAWGPSEVPRVVSLTTLLGAMGAAEWTAKGLDVPGLEGRLVPRYGVFSPTRRAYVDLLAHLDVDGGAVLDVGCGTGVLAFVLLQRGASRAVGTDMDARAIRCASDNAERLGLSDQFEAVEADLFPDGGRFDCIVFNAPWVPETPRTRLDRAVFDEEGRTLERFLGGAPAHLAEGGVIALLVSDLPERIGMREPDHVAQLGADAGLRHLETFTTSASHGRARDTDDPLHSARAAETIKLMLFASE